MPGVRDSKVEIDHAEIAPHVLGVVKSDPDLHPLFSCLRLLGETISQLNHMVRSNDIAITMRQESRPEGSTYERPTKSLAKFIRGVSCKEGDLHYRRTNLVYCV